MRTFIIAGLTALAMATPTLSFAQEADEPEDIFVVEQEAAKPDLEKIKAFTEARIAVLKAGLQLTPEQDKKWPALEQALRDVAKARQERWAAFRDRRKEEREQPKEQRDPIARLKNRADRLAARAAEMKKLADAAEPFYQSLNEDQKLRFGLLFRVAAGRPGGPHGFGHGPWGPRPPFGPAE